MIPIVRTLTQPRSWHHRCHAVPPPRTKVPCPTHAGVVPVDPAPTSRTESCRGWPRSMPERPTSSSTSSRLSHPRALVTGWLVTIVCAVLLMKPMATTALAVGARTTPAHAQPPVPGAVVRGFDPPDQPWLSGHRGVDLQAPAGAPVRSAVAGVVVVAGQVATNRVVVILMPDGRRLTHMPVEPSVQVGDVVHAGQVIGHVLPNTHCQTSCLHWGLKKDGGYENPLSLIGQIPVRLLPTGSRPDPDPAPTEVFDPASLPSAAGMGGASALLRPVPGPVSSPFGYRVHPVTHVRKLHDGVDLASGCGTPVHAAYTGRVVWVGSTRAWGNRVIVDHGTVGSTHLRTTYNHLESIGVSQGSVVLRGQVLGRVGSTGFSTGCHLHLGLERDGHLVDPLPYLATR